jgi:hypothetical protein
VSIRQLPSSLVKMQASDQIPGSLRYG